MSRLEEVVRFVGATLFGGVSAANGYLALDTLFSAATTKTVALQIAVQNQVPTSSDVTGDFYAGLIYAAVAGVTGGMALYSAAGGRK